MPIPIPDALDDHAALRPRPRPTPGRRRCPATCCSSALAGAYVGIAVVLLVSVSAPLVAAGSPATKLVQGAVFGVALTLVVFAGAELFTGNAMVMLQGLVAADRAAAGLAAVLVRLARRQHRRLDRASPPLVHGGGTLTGPGADLIAATVTGQGRASPGRSCSGARCCATRSSAWRSGWPPAPAPTAAKLAVLWWALLAFIGSGFEHSIANVTHLRPRRPRGQRRLGRSWPATCSGRCPATSSAAASSSASATPGSAPGREPRRDSRCLGGAVRPGARPIRPSPEPPIGVGGGGHESVAAAGHHLQPAPGRPAAQPATATSTAWGSGGPAPTPGGPARSWPPRPRAAPPAGTAGAAPGPAGRSRAIGEDEGPWSTTSTGPTRRRRRRSWASRTRAWTMAPRRPRTGRSGSGSRPASGGPADRAHAHRHHRAVQGGEEPGPAGAPRQLDEDSRAGLLVKVTASTRCSAAASASRMALVGSVGACHR